MTTTQDRSPADWGHDGLPSFRKAWQGSGTYRVRDRSDGASNTLRFAPLNSRRDNVDLDEAWRLFTPVEPESGRQISWSADG